MGQAAIHSGFSCSLPNYMVSSLFFSKSLFLTVLHSLCSIYLRSFIAAMERRSFFYLGVSLNSLVFSIVLLIHRKTHSPMSISPHFAVFYPTQMSNSLVAKSFDFSLLFPHFTVLLVSLTLDEEWFVFR